MTVPCMIGVWDEKMNDGLDLVSFLNGLVFYAPVALLVRTNAGVTMAQFFVLQAVLSLTVFLFEIPTGVVTDRAGYKNTMILAQVTMFLAKVLLLAAYIRGSFTLFVVEAVVEGFAACFLSGTQEAYIYSVYKDERYAVKMAHVANFGTAGFIVSTLLYVVLYHFGGIGLLIIATVAACGLGIFCVAGIEREPASAGREKRNPALIAGRTESESRTVRGGAGGVLALFADARMVLMVLLSAGFSLGFLLVNFFYVDKLLACGLREELMSPIILAYSVTQMLAEKMLDRTESARYRKAMFAAVLLSGAIMILFALSRTKAVVVAVMVLLPLFLSFPAFILDSIQNAYIDQNGQADRRATVLSIANMVGNLMEIMFLFASAYIVQIGVSACFAGAGILLIVLGLLCWRWI